MACFRAWRLRAQVSGRLADALGRSGFIFRADWQVRRERVRGAVHGGGAVAAQQVEGAGLPAGGAAHSLALEWQTPTLHGSAVPKTPNASYDAFGVFGTALPEKIGVSHSFSSKDGAENSERPAE